MPKLRVGVIYGGRSGEHEVSLASAASVIANLDPERYEIVPLRIERDGRWVLSARVPTLTAAGAVIAETRTRGDAAALGARRALLVAEPSASTVLTAEPSTPGAALPAVTAGLSLDVVFPVLHGPYGEDGTVQGLLELAGVPYVGAGVLASAVGMDKAVQKLIFAARHLPTVEHVVVMRRAWRERPREIEADVLDRLPPPIFVKPANLGSSVGISKVTEAAQLSGAIGVAAAHDRKIVVEAAVADAREIEIGVLGNDEPEVSVPGEVIPSREFYDYEAKYVDEGSRTIIPAEITDAQAGEIRRLAIDAYRALDVAGLARVDFLVARASGRVYLNEINTMPGFTTISMYAKLWEASGIPYPRLVDRLIELALERHRDANPSPDR